MSKKLKKTNQNEETELELALRITNSRFRSQGISLYKEFDTKMREAQEEDGEIRKLHLWEKAGPNAINVMFQILKEVRNLFNLNQSPNYKQLSQFGRINKIMEGRN